MIIGYLLFVLANEWLQLCLALQLLTGLPLTSKNRLQEWVVHTQCIYKTGMLTVVSSVYTDYSLTTSGTDVTSINYIVSRRFGNVLGYAPVNDFRLINVLTHARYDYARTTSSDMQYAQ